MYALLVAELPAALHNVLLCRVDHVVGTESLRKVLTFLGDLGDDDFGSAFGFQSQNDRDPDRTATQYQNGIAFLERADLDGVPTDSKWLDERWVTI